MGSAEKSMNKIAQIKNSHHFHLPARYRKMNKCICKVNVSGSVFHEKRDRHCASRVFLKKPHPVLLLMMMGNDVERVVTIEALDVLLVYIFLFTKSSYKDMIIYRM